MSKITSRRLLCRIARTARACRMRKLALACYEQLGILADGY
jgi:hypothetical protein